MQLLHQPMGHLADANASGSARWLSEGCELEVSQGQGPEKLGDANASTPAGLDPQHPPKAVELVNATFATFRIANF